MTMLVSPHEWICHKVARHEMVLPMDQIGSFLVNGKVADLVADLGQLKVNQVKRSTKLTAGDVPEKGKAHKQVNPAGEAAVCVWIWTNSQHADPTVDGMIVVGSLKHEGCKRRSPCA